MTLEVAVIHSLDDLGRWRPQWDELATAQSQPWMLSDWTEAWWRWRRPPLAELRALAVHRDGQLMGAAPWFIANAGASFGDYRLVGARSFFRMAPLAAEGSQAEVAAAMAAALAGASPRPATIRFEGVDTTSPWPALLAREWPGSAAADVYVNRAAKQPGPTVDMEGKSFRQWWESRSANFRKTMTRKRSAAEGAGFRTCLARTALEFESDFAHLVRLHLLRWRDRGGSDAIGPGDQSMICSAGAALASTGTARLFTLRNDETVAAALLAVAAGGEVVHHLHGFDDSWSEISPGLLTILCMIEDAYSRGDRRIDLAPGGDPYKWRFADRDEPLSWTSVVPPGPGSARARAALLVEQAASAARPHLRRLPLGVRTRLRRVLPNLP